MVVCGLPARWLLRSRSAQLDTYKTLCAPSRARRAFPRSRAPAAVTVERWPGAATASRGGLVTDRAGLFAARGDLVPGTVPAVSPSGRDAEHSELIVKASHQVRFTVAGHGASLVQAALLVVLLVPVYADASRCISRVIIRPEGQVRTVAGACWRVPMPPADGGSSPPSAWNPSV